MDLTQAIQAHGDWTKKFRVAIDEAQTLDAAAIAKDDQCVLGQWLHDPEIEDHYGRLNSFHDCKTKHRLFHTQAAEMAQLINRQQYDQARAQLMPGTTYREATEAVVLSIFKLKEEVAA